VEGLVRSLKDGDWLDLRESDHTYALSPHGLHLLSVLHAADFDNLAPANALARAAQNAAFGATFSPIHFQPTAAATSTSSQFGIVPPRRRAKNALRCTIPHAA
jgi:hypothetical protein